MNLKQHESPAPMSGPFFNSWRRVLKLCFLSVLGWGFVSIALGWQMSNSFSMSAAGLVHMAGRNWLTWSLLTAVIVLLVDRFPIEREQWRSRLLIHLVAGFVLLLCIGGVGQFMDVHKDILSPTGIRAGEEGKEEHDSADRHGKTPKSFLGGLFFGPQFPIYLAVFGVAHAWHFYRRSRERELRSAELMASLAEARLQTLRMQIQPHFLFNSLNALGSLIHKDANAADDMLMAISSFLRITLDESIQQEVSVRREFEFVEQYLTIEKARFGERLSYTLAPDAETLDAKLPSLLLQPLVENAVRHGIEQQKNVGTIAVRSWRIKDELHVSVKDNGPGFQDSVSEGIGLTNIRSRLRELYGDRASLTLRSNSGSEAIVSIPFRTA